MVHYKFSTKVEKWQKGIYHHLWHTPMNVFKVAIKLINRHFKNKGLLVTPLFAFPDTEVVTVGPY